ncbi:unnamed protein product, partial [Anisakis simplex]|uniref:GCP_C_terminal domain-containing protein n=1 Tax=Anisakis simplex TaxID=6269 RepID=A0A0M3JAF4_ANISI
MTQMLNVIRFHIVYNVVQVYTQRFNMELDDKSNDLDKLIRAHERCLAGLEEGLFLTEDCKDIRTLIASLCDLIFRAAQEYSKFDVEVANCVSAVQLTSSVWCGKDMSETARFEIEEDRIRVEETLQSLNSEYSVLARNINDKF